MTHIAFHFGAPDKLGYVCRLLRKAAGSGARVLLVADASTGNDLDALLWAVSPADFVTHCQSGAPGALAQRSSVLLAQDIPVNLGEFSVLVNLADSVPAGFESFKRVIEVVSLNDEDRMLARARWKHYSVLGYEIERHDLKLKGAH